MSATRMAMHKTVSARSVSRRGLAAFLLIASALSMPAPPLAADEPPAVNLIVNPDFSNGTAGWDGLWTREAGQGRVSVKTLTHDRFSHALVIEHEGKKDWSYQQSSALPAAPGEMYRYAGWLNASGSGRAELSVILYDKKGAVLEWQWGLRTMVRTDGWKFIERKFVVPAGVSGLRFRLTGAGPVRVLFSGAALEKIGRTGPGPTKDIAVENAVTTVRFRAADGALIITAKGVSIPFIIEDFGRSIHPALLAEKNHSAFAFSVFNAYGDDASGRIELAADGAVTLRLAGKGEMEDAVIFPGTWRAQAGTQWVIPENEGLLIPASDPHYHQEWEKAFYAGHGDFSMPFIGLTDGVTGWLMIVETPDDAAARYAKPAAGSLSSWQTIFRSSLGAWGDERRILLRPIGKDGYVGIAKAYRLYAKGKGLLVTMAEKAGRVPAAARLPGCVDLWFWKKAEWWQNEPEPQAFAKELHEAGVRRVLWSSEAGAAGVAAMNSLGFLTGRYDITQDVYPPGSPDWMSALNAEAWPSGLVLDQWGAPIPGWAARLDGKEIVGGVVCSVPGLDILRRRVNEELARKPYSARFLDTTTASPLRECWNPAHRTTRALDREFKRKQLEFLSMEKKLVTGSETGQDWAVPALHYFEGMMSLGRFRLPDAGYDLTSEKKPTDDFLRFQVGYYYRIPLFELVYHDCVVSYYYWGDASNRLPAWWRVRDLWNVLYGTGPLWIMDYERWKRDKTRFVESYWTATAVAARTGFSEMLEHRFLTPDHAVQSSRFANGVAVWVNFGKTPYRLPDGSTLSGGAYLIAE